MNNNVIIRNYYAFANSFNINYYSSAQKCKAQCILYIYIYLTHIFILYILYIKHTHIATYVYEKKRKK